MTFMYSSSILIRNVVVGNPAEEGTVSVVWLAFTAPASVVLAPGPTRQAYELAGVSSNVPTLVFQFG
jgi:hypothetical protein